MLVTDAWGAVKEWGGWAIGSLATVIGIGGAAKRTLEQKLDDRIEKIVNPKLLNETLADIKASVDETRSDVKGLIAEVATLKGKEEVREQIEYQIPRANNIWTEGR